MKTYGLLIRVRCCPGRRLRDTDTVFVREVDKKFGAGREQDALPRPRGCAASHWAEVA
jgi:hypothetical protein